MLNRRRRGRAAIGLTALVALFALVAAGCGGGSGTTQPTTDLGFLDVRAEMTANQYEALRNGEEEEVLISKLGSGLEEDGVDQGLLALFPAQPGGSHCAFWTLSDAPGHLARLCFDDDRGVLLQKSVAARGEGAAPKTLS